MRNIPYIDKPEDYIIAWRDKQPIKNKDFQVKVQSWAAILKQKTGTKFAVYFNDSIEFLAVLWGCWLVEKTVYLVSDTLPATVTALSSEVDGYIGEFTTEYSPILNNECVENIAVEIKTDFPALVVFTSGTTGKPQAITKLFSQLIAEVQTLENLFGHLVSNTEIVATVSHQHIYGFLFKLLWPAGLGRIIHARSAVFLEELIPLLSTRNCVLISSPAHLKRFPDSPSFKRIIKQIPAVFSSGAALSVEIAQAVADNFGAAPIEIYGSSETGGIAWRQLNFATAKDNTYYWRVMPTINWRVENEILEIQSPHLPTRDWMQTSDKAVFIDAQHFMLAGRADRIVKIEGKRVSLDAIEHGLLATDLIADARALVVNAPAYSQRIAVFIILNTVGKQTLTKLGKLALNQLLREKLANQIDSIALPRFWRYLDALPVNAQGKTSQAELLALLEKSTTKPVLPHSRLISRDLNRAIYELTIPENLIYFDGHFPDIAVLPGVVQLNWAIHYARQSFNSLQKFCGIQALKFQHLCKPNMSLHLKLDYNEAKKVLSFSFSSQTGKHASGRILFEDDIG